jgi:APA family basic amino acid/polyamine antiporter
VVIGAGIYILVGPATAHAGGLVWLSMLVAGALCALTAFSYMELTAMFPKSGSEYEFARQVFPDWISFATGWAMTMALVVASAAVGLGFARYLNVFFDVNERLAALALIVTVGIIALTGMQHAKWLVILLSAVQIGGLLLVIAFGFHHVGDVSLTSGHGFSGVLGGASVIFFAYIGFDEVITLAEETHSPHKTIPRALLLALIISTILYIGVSVVAVSVLGVDALAVSTQPLTDVMREAIGGTAVTIVALVALATTANTTLLATTAASRMIYSMADSGPLPSRWGKVHDQHSPREAIIIVTILSATLSLLGGLQSLASATNALIYFMFLSVNLVVIILRYRQPEAHRPFRIAFTIKNFPVVPSAAIIATLSLSTQLELQPVLLALGFLASGIVVFNIGKAFPQYTAQ